MSEKLTVSGIVATTPRHLVTQNGLPITTFRLATSQQKFDVEQNKWVAGDTNWYTITTLRQMAMNIAQCVSKGDRLLVVGRVKVNDWDNGERSGINIEIEAESVGHDLAWGKSVYTRTVLARDVIETPPPVYEF